ncbi:Hypothetical protein NCS54_00888200 [Fusarium falciforme]|uniref:Hypothetical protein n=1 Tax=Fusarium falciforme TaxID=195108 RepID=UPI002300BEA0|nr:Hypothetical protein NCS54_00888200 [Fusarium falciforme]WAO91414.1 Hypothetical protein NCS54_00888200 [Fusarium falciforme]
MSLQGKVAIVSGSSAGIGAAIAKELSGRGATVAINYPFPSEKANADAVLQSFGPEATAIAVEADLSTFEGPKLLVKAVTEAFGKIDILVNNAGVVITSELDEPDDKVISEIWDKTINLNGRGVLLLTRACLPYLRGQNSRIINIASGISRAAGPKQSIYAGSKGIVESFTRCWAKDLPPKYGCTVNAVAPGPIGTESLLSTPQEVQDDLIPVIQNTPVAKRLGKPEEVAYTVAVLCEDKASWINGAWIPVTGGFLLS